MSIENLLANVSFFLLFCTMIFYWVQGIFFSNRNLFFFGNLGMLCSNICLLSLLILRWQNSGHFPLSNLYESLIFLSWGVTTIHLVLQKINQHKNKEKTKYNINFNLLSNPLKIDNRVISELDQDLFISLWLGCITSPTALFINAFASFSLPDEMQRPGSLVPALQSNWLFMHVSVMILSYASLIIGCLLSFVFLIITEGKEINLNNSLFRKYYSDSILMSKFLLNKNFKNNFFVNEKILGKKLIIIQNNFLFINKKRLLFKQKRDNIIFIEKWLKKFNLSFSSTLDFFYLLIKSNTSNLYSLSGMTTNFSLSFCYDRPIINIENKNLFQKNYSHDEGVSTQERRIKRKRQFSKNKKNLTYKIANNLDNLSYRILGIGFPFLTIGILSGSVWANEAWGSYWSWDPKETWALLTWLVFAVYFHSRLIKGWEGKKPAILATLGFIVVWICFIGVNLLKSGLHSYGFFS
nr:heme attachment to plastid cytochrome c [Oedogonium sp. 260-2_chl]